MSLTSFKKKVMLYYCSTQKQQLGNIKNLVSLIWLIVCTQGSVIHLFISVCLIVPVNLLTTTLWGSEPTYLALVTVGRIVTASSVNALSTEKYRCTSFSICQLERDYSEIKRLFGDTWFSVFFISALLKKRRKNIFGKVEVFVQVCKCWHHVWHKCAHSHIHSRTQCANLFRISMETLVCRLCGG